MNRAARAADPGQALLIGCDVGTSAVKSILMSADGELLGHHVAEHPLHHPKPGWTESDPVDWCRGVARGVRSVIEDASADTARVVALGVVAQREPVVLIDDHGGALGPAISWTDRRTDEEASEVTERFGRSWLIERTGMVPVPGCTLTHLLWYRRHRRELWRQARKIRFAKDYVVHRLTGAETTDVSTPSRSLMLDVHRGDWSPEICDAFEIDIARLPEIRQRPWEQIGELTPQAAGELGLPSGTPVAMGGADDTAATLGGGAIEPGDVCIGTGTAANWRRVTDRAIPDLSGRSDLAPHVVPDRFVYELAIESTGSSLRWLRETFAPELSYGELIEEAGRIQPGANGLKFYPFVDGAGRAPRYLPNVTGSFLGIVSGHTRAHLVRALLEGVAYQYPATMAVASDGRSLRPPLVTGDGEARSQLWSQIKADVLGVPLRVPRVVELAAAGAVILAGIAAGVFKDAAAGVSAVVRWERQFDPDPARHAVYDRLRAEHEHIFDLITPHPHAKELYR